MSDTDKPDQEVEKRRDDALRRALNTPPKPKKDGDKSRRPQKSEEDSKDRRDSQKA